MSVDDFLGGGFLEGGEDDDEVRVTSVQSRCVVTAYAGHGSQR